MQYKSSAAGCTHLHTPLPHHSLLHSPTPLDYKELLPLKIAFTHWIKTLPMEERFVAVKIHAPGLSLLIRSIFWQRPSISLDRNFEYQALREDSLLQSTPMDPRKTASKLQKHLFESLVFLSDGHDFLDHLCFDYSLLQSPERLFDILTCNVRQQQAKLMQEALNSKRSLVQMVKVVQQIKIKELLLEQLLSFMRQSVLLNFRNSLIDPQRISNLLDEQKQRKKDFSIFWRNISPQHRENLLLLECKDTKALKMYLQREAIGLSEQELQREISELLLLQKNEFCNKIFKCKLKKSLHPLLDYYHLVYLIWKKDVDKNKKKKHGKCRRQRDYNSMQKNGQKETRPYKKKEKNRKSTSVESNQTNQTEHQRIFAQHSRSNDSLENNQTPAEQTKSQKMDENQEEANFYLKKAEINDNSYDLGSVQEEKPPKNQHQPNKMIKKEKQECCNCQTPTKKQVYTYQPATQLPISHQTVLQTTLQETNKLTQEAIIESSLEKLELQLQEMSDQISEQANFYHQRRVVAFQRIQFLLNYYSIPIKLFGSCANGIAVKNSDIDIAIDQQILSSLQFIPEGEKVRVALQNVQQLLSNYPTFKQIKVIKTAAIPVMKVTIDTQVPFLGPEYGQTYFVLNRTHNCGPIHADITIQTPNTQNQSSHLGIRTTNTITQWLASIKSLRSIVIVMKSLLTTSRLNLAYEGGLNTFAMIVMIVASIKHMKLQNEDNSALILRSILHFYVEEFNEKEYGIDLQNKSQAGIFFLKEKTNGSPSKTMKADLQIIDPICQHKNMTRNCYLYPQIKQLFKKMLKTCFQGAQSELAELSQKQVRLKELSELNKQIFGERNLFRQLQSSITTNF